MSVGTSSSQPDRKQCSCCKEVKLLTLFYIQKNGKYGRTSACGECSRVRAARVKALHKGKAPRREVLPDGVRRCTSCRIIKSLDDFHLHRKMKFGRAYVCRSCSCAKSAAYFKSGKGLVTTKQNRMTVGGRASQILRSIKYRAKKNGLEFDLTREWVIEKLSGRCEFTGKRFIITGNGDTLRGPWSPSVDKIDVTRGYTIDNCRMVVLAFNQARSNWGDESVRELARAILGLTEKTAPSMDDASLVHQALH